MIYQFKNKKSSIYDPITVGAFILSLAITIFIMIYVWYGFDSGIRDVVSNNVANETVVDTLNNLSLTYSYIDYMIPILIGGLMILSLIFAFKTGAGIIYSFLSLLVWGFGMLMASVYTNVFELFKNNFPIVAANYPILVFVMENIKWIILAWLFLISLVMFTRTKQEDDQILKGGLEQYYGA